MLKRQRRAAWQGIDADTRNRIKDNVAGTIGASQPLARMAAAQVVAKIGAIEIQPGLNTWEDLLQGLIGTAARGDLPDGPRSAALHALGYLLEELDEYDESPLMQPEVDSALTAICGCMASGAVPVQRAAVDAMFNALPFVAENFEDKDRVSERNAIMMAICNATQVEDAEVKRMRCVVGRPASRVAVGDRKAVVQYTFPPTQQVALAASTSLILTPIWTVICRLQFRVHLPRGGAVLRPAR